MARSSVPMDQAIHVLITLLLLVALFVTCRHVSSINQLFPQHQVSFMGMPVVILGF
jgi:hypothetical protein